MKKLKNCLACSGPPALSTQIPVQLGAVLFLMAYHMKPLLDIVIVHRLGLKSIFSRNSELSVSLTTLVATLVSGRRPDSHRARVSIPQERRADSLSLCRSEATCYRETLARWGLLLWDN